MDGKDRLQAQVRCGTRLRVLFVDECRIKYGVTSLESLTPRAETRLRSGEEASIPLKMRYISINRRAALVLTLRNTYPISPIEVSILEAPGRCNDSPLPDALLSVQNSLQAYCDAEANKEEHSPVAVDVLAQFEELMRFQVDLPTTDTELAVDAWTSYDSEGKASDVLEDISGELSEEPVPSQSVETPFDCVAGDNSGTLQPHIEESTPECTYRCHRCRAILFRSSHLITHKAATAGAICTSLFIEMVSAEPGSDDEVMGVQRMEAPGSCDPDSQKGVLSCSKCKCKLGSWSWVGLQCSCQEWVCPAFQIPASRVDAGVR